MQRTLLGMITPSSNTVLEPYTSAILYDCFPDITAHFQRFTVKEIALSEGALAQFELEPLLEAAALLADARMDVIAWSGTAASWLGFQHDEALCAAITARTHTPATTSILALNEVLQSTQVERLGLVTPYLSDVQEAIIRNYNQAGHTVVAERHLNDRGNFSFSEYSEEVLERLIREVATEQPEAITVLCTNMRGAQIAEKLEQELGIPIYDSVSVTVWKSLRLSQQRPDQIQGWGSVFTNPKLNP